MVRIKFNGQFLDIDESVKVVITRQLNTLDNLSNRQTSFTNSFQIKLTGNNLNILDGLIINGNETRLPYKKNNVDVIIDGVTVLKDGYAQISKVDLIKKTATMTLYGGELVLMNKLKELKLHDYYSNYAFWLGKLSKDNITGSWTDSNILNAYFVYALSNFDYKDTENDKVIVTKQYPSLFFKGLWDWIFYAVLHIQTDWRPDESIVFTPEKAYKFNDDVILPFSDERDVEPTAERKRCWYDDDDNSYKYLEKLQWQGSSNEHFDSNEQVFLAPATTTYNIDISVKGSAGDSTNLYQYIDWITIYAQGADGSVRAIVTILQNVNYENSNGELVTGVSWQGNVALNKNDKVWVGVVGKLQSPQFCTTAHFHNLDGDITFELETQDYIPYNPDDIFNPNYTMDKFFKLNVLMNGFLFEVNDNKVRFKTISDVLNGEAVDLSDNLRNIKTIDYNLKGFGRYNWLKWSCLDEKDDVDYAWNGYLYIANDFVPEQKTVIKSDFRASSRWTVTPTYIDFLQYTPLRRWRLNENNEWESDDTGGNSYIARIQKNNGSLDFIDTENDTSVETYTGDFYKLNFVELDWWKMLNDNYKGLELLLNYNKRYLVDLEMTALDFYNLDLMKLVYFKQLGALFYINKIKYKGKGKVEAELIYVKKR